MAKSMVNPKQAYREVSASNVQRSDQQAGAQDGLSPTGESVLYKANPESSVTPNTMGHTTSRNQLTTSGK